MKKIKLSLIVGLLASSTMLSADYMDNVEVSTNVALTSNYVWRGMTQTGNAPAIQGGIDASYKGLYIGLWASSYESTDASSEFDVYFGYSSEIGALSYDIGFIEYMYPNSSDESNQGEAYLNIGYDFDILSVSATYYMGIDTHNVSNEAVNGWEPGNAWEVGVSIPVIKEISLDLMYGQYDNGGTQNVTTNEYGDYYSIGASKSFDKYDVTLAYTGMDYEDATSKDQDNVVLTIGTSF